MTYTERVLREARRQCFERDTGRIIEWCKKRLKHHIYREPSRKVTPMNIILSTD